MIGPLQLKKKLEGRSGHYRRDAAGILKPIGLPPALQIAANYYSLAPAGAFLASARGNIGSVPVRRALVLRRGDEKKLGAAK